MKRQAVNDLTMWFRRGVRKPLILRGARQVGKSTLVRQFAQSIGIKLIEINLEKQRLLTLKEEGIDINKLIQEVEALTNQRVDKNSLIFFDEIQEQPKLLSALRYFYEEKPELAVIAAGSLLDFALTQQEYAIPVGRVEYYFLGPMKFSEFLEALGENILLDHIKKVPHSLLESVHRRLLKRYREFLYVGGMPEAVATYVSTNSPLEVRRVQRSIVQTYEDDFIKYTKHAHVDRVRAVFNYTPGYLGQKVKYSEILREEKSRDMKSALDLLEKARVIFKVIHSNANSVPLKSQSDESVYKLYFLDVGLAQCLQGTEWNFIVNDPVGGVLRGAIAEQFVAQHLYYKNDGFETPELFYWLRDKKKQNAEVDFVLSKNGRIVPIEVKAESVGSLKSLLVFMAEKKLSMAIKVDASLFQSDLVEKRIQTTDRPVIFELMTVTNYLVERIYDLV